VGVARLWWKEKTVSLKKGGRVDGSTPHWSIKLFGGAKFRGAPKMDEKYWFGERSPETKVSERGVGEREGSLLSGKLGTEGGGNQIGLFGQKKKG